MQVSRWHVDVFLSADDQQTHARAVLHADSPKELTGVGNAWHAPRGPVVPEIAAEMATAGALADLSRRLIRVAGADVQDILDREQADA